MNQGRIFLVNPQKKQLMPMAETPYAQEVVLQEYLVAYPDLLAGDQIDPENPRRWLLVKREIGVPGSEEGSDIWSLDHLFLDQDGIPTFVECKRISDTRIRREVVAQMLDYAANGTAYWPVDRLRQAATETAAQNNLSLDEELARLLDDDEEETIDGFWEKVEQNLREGIVRLLFVADETPRELRRLVEFLNAKMNDVEVLAVEIKQFLGQGQTALVPASWAFPKQRGHRNGRHAAHAERGNKFWRNVQKRRQAFSLRSWIWPNHKGMPFAWVAPVFPFAFSANQTLR